MTRRQTSQRGSQTSKSVVHKITGVFRIVKKTFVSQNNMRSFYKCHIDEKLFSNLGEKR